MKIMFIIFVLVLSTLAHAQNHMVEFKADSLLIGSFTFSDSNGHRDSNHGSLVFNFARSVSEHIQVGVQGGYNRSKSSYETSESYSALVGAIYNFNTDFRDTFYASLYAGGLWTNYYSGHGNVRSEYLIPKVSFGKRIPLTRFSLENVTYTPEVSYQYMDETSSGYWTQSVSIKFLQFSLFW